MDLNPDDILNVEIDPLLLESYNKLSLEDNHDYFNGFPIELSKNDLPDFENISANEDIDTCKDQKDSEKGMSKDVTLDDDKHYVGKKEVTISLNKSMRSDINGNEASESDENLNNLFTNLKISNLGENTTASQLKERAPIRAPKRSNQLREQYSYTRDNIDVSSINRERRLFLSGSTYSQPDGVISTNNLFNDGFSNKNIVSGGSEINEIDNTHSLYGGFINSSRNDSIVHENIFPATCSDLPLYQDSTTSSLNASAGSQNESYFSLYSNNDSFYDDSVTNSVCSPTNSVSSGYETSSPLSQSSPPPKIPLPYYKSNLDFLPEIINEQDIFDIVVDLEATNCEPTKNIFLPSEYKSYEQKIHDYIHYFKDAEKDVTKLPATPSDTSKEMTLANNGDLTNISFVKTNRYCTPADGKSLVLDLKDNNYEEKVKNYCQDAKNDFTGLSPSSYDVSFEFSDLINNFNSNNVSSAKASKSSLQNSSNPPIVCMPLKDEAKRSLRDSLSTDKVHALQDEIYHKLNEAIWDNKVNCAVAKRNPRDKNVVKVIYVEDKDEKTSENQTNLHLAVLNSEIEKIYCLVEIHKQYNESFTELSLRDKHGKTALDYAVKKKLNLVIDYLKENNAYPSLKI